MAAADSLAGYDPGFVGPAARAAAVTPDDANDLVTVTRWLYVGGAGAVALVTAGGDAVTFAALAAGTLLPVRAARIKATGTTATNLLALW